MALSLGTQPRPRSWASTAASARAPGPPGTSSHGDSGSGSPSSSNGVPMRKTAKCTAGRARTAGTGRGRGRAGEGASEPWSLSAHRAGNFGVSSGGGAGRRGRPMGRGQRGRGGPGATRRDQDRDRGWEGGSSARSAPTQDARYPTIPPIPFFSGVRIPPAPSPGLGEPGPRPPSRPLLPPHTVSRESTAAGGARRDARARGGGSGANVLPRPHCGGAEPAGTPSFPRAPPLPFAARVG